MSSSLSHILRCPPLLSFLLPPTHTHNHTEHLSRLVKLSFRLWPECSNFGPCSVGYCPICFLLSFHRLLILRRYPPSSFSLSLSLLFALNFHLSDFATDRPRVFSFPTRKSDDRIALLSPKLSPFFRGSPLSKQEDHN
jgi:hypothetical protein